MYLKCKVCGNARAIAKYYPSEEEGWYSTETHLKQMNDLFKLCDHEKDGTNFGGYQYELEYEVEEINKNLK